MAIKKDDAIADILKLIAPGTPIRNGLENILKAKTGALIAVGGDTKEVLDLVDGGFKLDVEYTSSRLYELAKMDGAIVLSSDFKKILYANAQLIPSSDISTTETGTRHRTAERTAKQTGSIVISISQRRGIITIFKGNLRYVLKDSELSVLKEAIYTVYNGGKYYQDELAPLVKDYDNGKKGNSDADIVKSLTKREIQVLTLISKGTPNREIGEQLNISEKTVKNHISKIFKKIGINDRTMATVFAIKNNIVEI